MKKIIILFVSILIVSCSKESEPTMYTLTVTSNPTEGGTISPSGGEYEDGTVLTIRVTPNTNYEFDRWSGSVSGGETSLSITMDGNKSIVGNFVLSDTDGDGVTDDVDTCPNTPSGQTVDSNGCSDSQIDTDGDGVNDDVDTCPDTPSGETVDENGCSDSQKDTDGDGVNDDVDTCPNTPSGESVDENGCIPNPLYLDSNGITIKSYEWGEVGDTGEVNGVLYTIVDRPMLLQMKNNNEDVSVVCTTKITDMRMVFGSVGYEVNGDISTWDVSNVTIMDDMFSYSNFNGDISNWDVSNVYTMWSIFSQSQFNGDISNWDVSNVTNMSFMFLRTPFNGDISNWDVSSVTRMSSMFDGSQFNGDISNWNVSNVTLMDWMFRDTPFNGDISNWDVSSVRQMREMFRNNTSFNYDLSGWNVSNVSFCENFSSNTPQWTLPKPNFTNCTP